MGYSFEMVFDCFSSQVENLCALVRFEGASKGDENMRSKADKLIDKCIEAYENRVQKNRLRKWIYRKLYPFRCIRYGHQRICRGYCDRDVWDIDHWFYRVVVPMINQFRKETDTIPRCIADRFTDSVGRIDEKAAVEYWDRELRKMIWLFRESDEETSCGGKLKGEVYMEMCKKRAFSMFCEYFHDLWD